MIEKAEKLCKEWHEVGRVGFEKDYNNLDYDGKFYIKHVVEKRKYICMDRGNSGVFLLDKTDGMVYRIKGYGVPNKKKCLGHIDKITGAMLDIAGKFL